MPANRLFIPSDSGSCLDILWRVSRYPVGRLPDQGNRLGRRVEPVALDFLVLHAEAFAVGHRESPI